MKVVKTTKRSMEAVWSTAEVLTIMQPCVADVVALPATPVPADVVVAICSVVRR